jgi:hypothetical protein
MHYALCHFGFVTQHEDVIHYRLYLAVEFIGSSFRSRANPPAEILFNFPKLESSHSQSF